MTTVGTTKETILKHPSAGVNILAQVELPLAQGLIYLEEQRFDLQVDLLLVFKCNFRFIPLGFFFVVVQ